MIDPKDIENRLQETLKECASLREENERLKRSWQEDAAVFLGICEEIGIPVAVERSGLCLKRHKYSSFYG